MMEGWFQIICLVLFTHNMLISADKYLTQFKIQHNTSIGDGFTFKKGIVSDKTECAMMCEAEEMCSSASFNKNSRSCCLSVHRIYNDTDERLISGSSWLTMTKNNCPVNGTKIGGVCYFIKTEKGTNEDARRYCEERGGKLAEPKTNETLQALRPYLDELSGTTIVWFGLIGKKTGDNRTFVWSTTGNIPSYTYWKDDEPKGKDLTIVMRKYSGWKWATQASRQFAAAVCEN